jgi:hypothetical protein
MTLARPTLKALIAITAAIVCGTIVAISAHTSLLRTAREQTARLSQVTATVIEPAVPELSQPAIGTWTTADGTRRTGIIDAPPDHYTGMSHPIWINEAGQPTAPPKSPLHRGVQTALVGTAVAAAIIILTHRSPHADSGLHTRAADRYRMRSTRTPGCRCTSGHGRREGPGPHAW